MVIRIVTFVPAMPLMILLLTSPRLLGPGGGLEREKAHNKLNSPHSAASPHLRTVSDGSRFTLVTLTCC
jgi:hypothetical protein